MTSIAKNPVAKVAAVVAGFVLLFTFALPAQAALTESQISSILSLLQSFGADASTVANVEASLRGTTPTIPSTPSTPSVGCYAFTRDLTLGAQGADVTALQAFLRAKGHFTHPTDTGYFGSITQTAVAAWQSANGVTPPAGYFGSKSKAAYNTQCGGTSTTPTTPVPTGTGLSVAACPTQPVNSLAPQGAVRVPLTCFKVTAGNDGDVTINSVAIQKDGLFSNAALSGAVLVRARDGMQLGVARSLNSNNQATIGETFTVSRGSTEELWVMANMAASLSSYAGESVGLAVIGVNTSATVSGSLPITGAHQITNATLTVGTLTTANSSAFAANSPTTTEEIGDTGLRATGLRLTAGSSEDMRLYSIRWNQTGSVGANDLTNVTAHVNGVAYPMVVSSDGKYYSASFGNGIVITKGNAVETYISYDIIGGSNRTIVFHIDRSTDIYAKGETYGYGANISGGSTANPYIFGQQVTVTGSTVTTISRATEVASQNIANNVPNQVLGGFYTQIAGEPLTVQSMVFTVATSGSGTSNGIPTNVTLVDQNGAVVAGPVDGAYTSSSNTLSVTFTDSVTIPTGKMVYTLKGKVPAGVANGATYIVTTVPSSGWTNVKGNVTGNTVTFTNGSFSMSTMTVKAGAAAVTRATTPSSFGVVAGATGVLMANLQFDASQSGEDITFSSVPLSLAFTTGVATDLTNCLIYDGATAVSSTSVNPSGSTPYTVTATLSQTVTIPKGSLKTLGIRCNVATGATANGVFTWDHGAIGSFSFQGVSSGQSITGTAPADTASSVTVLSGSVTITTDSTSPAYKLVAGGTTDNTAGAYRLTAANEGVWLTELALQLTSYASSSIADIPKVSIYDGATKVGEAFFTTDGGSGAVSISTSTLTTPLLLAKDLDKVLTIKLDTATIGNNQAATSSGHLIVLNFISGKGTGQDSGTAYNLGAANGSTSVAGVRVMKSYPTVALGTLPSTGLADGRLGRFTVTANSSGSISLTEFNFLFATTSVVLTNVNVYAYTDSSYSQKVTGIGDDGAVSQTMMLSCTTGLANPCGWASSATNFEVQVTDSASASTTIQVPAGTTYYFEVRGTVAGVTTGSTVVTTLRGDTAAAFSGGYPPSMQAGRYSNPMGRSWTDGGATSTICDLVAECAFIWSPNSTTSATRTAVDWTDGTSVPGLPSNGLIMTRSQ